MEMTKNQKKNLLEFLNRTQLVGKEAITLVNLMYAIANSGEISTDTQVVQDSPLTPVSSE